MEIHKLSAELKNGICS